MNGEATVQLPRQMATAVQHVDGFYYLLYWLSVVLFVAITGTALYFVWKYRRRPGVKAQPTGHNTVIEVAWTVAPLFLLIYLFHVGFRGYISLRVAPANAMNIYVRAYQWGWEFSYPNGAVEGGTLHVPVNRPVRMVMNSDDVLHAFYVPQFRVKQDVVPGQYNTVWFQATQTGEADLFCAEYCGAPAGGGRPGAYGHSTMYARVIIQPEREFNSTIDALLRRPDRFRTDAEWGAALYTQFNCNTCHSVDGSAGQGPTWRGLFGRQREFADGTSAVADENYIRTSILQPQAQLVRGFGPVMPRVGLRNPHIQAIIEYIRTLR